ncbi:MAG: hypothetical protein NTU98_11855 [Bacteroidetes bacterium]|nr:hypothetical protein [Bacteroidota bacterium]
MKILAFLLFVLPCGLLAQNLVINPDFEARSGCPNASGQFILADQWFTPNAGTPDYFNDCSPSIEYGTEYNTKGGQIPHSGHGYMGIQSENLHKNAYFEYLETHLSEPLKSGQLYCIRLYISLGDCDFALNELGIVISQNILKNLQDKKIVLPHVSLTNGALLADEDRWMCIKSIYRGKGGEKFLTIGYFNKDDNFTRVKGDPNSGSMFRSAYYFIDDVSLEAVSDSTGCKCTP